MTDVNSSKSIAAIVFLAVVGPCVFILQPGFVQGLVELIGFSEQESGRIASYEMFGIASSTVLMSLISSRVPWRRMTAVFLAICTLGNIASYGVSDYQTLATIRFITGIGSGGVISLTFTMMGLTDRSDRNFGWIIVWVLTYGALGLLVMPTAFSMIGMNGVLLFFAAFCAFGLAVVRNLPDGGDIASGDRDMSYSRLSKGTALTALLAYNIAIGLVWAYLFLIGLSAGMDEQAVANALTVSQFLGIVGAFCAVVFEIRFGRSLSLAVGVLGGAGSVVFLVGDTSAGAFWVGVCVFNFLWNLSVPYLLGTLAELEAGGRIVVHGVSMQFVGLAIGPLLAAHLLAARGYDGVNSLAIVLFVVAAALLLPSALAQRARLVESN